MIDIHYKKIIIHAPNIHQGGGMISLMSLLTLLQPHQIQSIHIDARANLSNLKQYPIKKINPSLTARLLAELQLPKAAKNADCVICLGNLPPVLELPCQTIVYIQNRLLVDPKTISLFPFKVRLRLRIERLWQRLFMRQADELWVQTPSMYKLVRKQFPNIPTEIHTLMMLPAQKPTKVAPSFDFIYVASLLPHKNHQRLIQAWICLANKQIRPSLLLICNDDNSKLSSWIHEQINAHGLKIIFQHEMSHDDIFDAYAQARALIYPSLIESYGMPLVEAAHVGLSILASNLDYVHDVAVPAKMFNPYAPADIARAITQFLETQK